MKTLKLFTLLTLVITFSSCSNDDNTPTLLDIESITFSNLNAPQEGGQGDPISGNFAKFNFETGSLTTSETDWDIAFRGTAIIINGGASFGATDEPERTGNAAVYIENATMASVTEVTTTSLIQDSEDGYAIIPGSGNGWYSYAGPPTHLITPIAGKILIVRTRDGKYAKIEILSYYKDAPENPDAFVDEDGYYTFNYVYNPNQGEITFNN